MRKLFFGLSLAIALVACGDDKGSSPNRLPDEVADMYELEDYKCDDSVSGAVVYVKDKRKKYECDGDHWFESYNQSKSSSSKKKLSSSSIVSSPVEGTLTDTRDGQTYKTVRIGDQVWMAENLNYETDSSFCYNDSVKYCEKYGRLYRWAAAVGKSESECGYGYTCSLPSGNIQGQVSRNGKLCSTLSVGYRRQARSLSSRLDGIAVAMARMLSGSRRSLLATGATVGVSMVRVTTRTSGVLRRTRAITRMIYTCTTKSTVRDWMTTTSTSVFLFVASGTDICYYSLVNRKSSGFMPDFLHIV